MTRFASKETKQPGGPYAAMIEDRWSIIRAALEKRDPMAALQEWGRSIPQVQFALHKRTEAWLASILAIPATKEHPWQDTEGLNRLIYRIWPEIPLRSFSMEDLPRIMAEMAVKET